MNSRSVLCGWYPGQGKDSRWQRWHRAAASLTQSCGQSLVWLLSAEKGRAAGSSAQLENWACAGTVCSPRSPPPPSRRSGSDPFWRESRASVSRTGGTDTHKKII